jgi:diaminopimelate decarboxylase
MLFGNIDRDCNGELTFAGRSLSALAEEYGCPLLLMDEERIRSNCRMYKEAMQTYFGTGSEPLCASKAASFKQIYRIISEEGIGVDTVSIGEIHTAISAGFPAEKIYFHGNCKTDSDISFALDNHVGYFVVDNVEELLELNRQAGERSLRQKILLRVTPGIDPHTYDAVNTGNVDSKFGIAIETGQAEDAIKLCVEQPNIELCGLHCHVGSQVFDEDVFQRTLDIMLPFMSHIRSAIGVSFGILNLGGGYGVPYLESEGTVDIPARIAEVASHLKQLCLKLNYPLPTILMEPGRSIVADAGMTLYRVASVKRIPGYKSYVAVDGGMTDNPRYALYGSKYTVLHQSKINSRNAVFDLVGRCCESGDIIQPDVMLPEDTCRGDLIAVCTTGAYNYSMASNYNRICRPPVVMLAKDYEYIAVRRETIDDIIALDI